MKTYKITTTFGHLLVRADLSQATEPILVLTEDPDAENGYRADATNYRTADAGHDPLLMARLAVAAQGAEYWQEPGRSYDDADWDQAIDDLILSVEEVV